MRADVLFTERQYFRQWWVLLFIAGLEALMIWAFVQQIVMGIPWGDNPASDELLAAILIVFGILFPLMLLSARLEVTVERTRLLVRFFPFQVRHRVTGRDDLLGHEVVTYSALREFGGAGIRYGRRGKAYIVSGDRGVQLTFANGDRLLLGSRRAEELDAALTMMSSMERSLGQ
ncbi:hypothetical protein AOA80_10960 [Methanomassiliicoccales archaeon RumEn M1]|nr:hypothetical protein AOA80_10960 [Methanomassiliicoccales archaeon RumEn M1]